MAGSDDVQFDRSKFCQAIATRIRDVRLSCGYSQDRLALESGLTRGALSKIEKGIHDPKASTLLRIAEVLDVPVATLFPDHR